MHFALKLFFFVLALKPGLVFTLMNVCELFASRFMHLGNCFNILLTQLALLDLQEFPL